MGRTIGAMPYLHEKTETEIRAEERKRIKGILQEYAKGIEVISPAAAAAVEVIIKSIDNW